MNVYNFNYTLMNGGSGVIISEDGYIVTNSHILDNNEKIIVRLKNNYKYEAVLGGQDKISYSALTKINADNLIPANIALC